MTDRISGRGEVRKPFTESGSRLPTTSGSHSLVGGDLFISVKAVEWVFENSKSSGNSRVVLLVLAAHYREGSAWPSFETIARLANVSRPTLSKAISELEDLGELQVEREDGTVNNYFFPKFEAVKTSKVLEPNRLSSAPKPVNPSLPKELVLEKLKTEEGVLTLPLCKEERRAIPKPVREPKVRKGFNKTIPPKREYVPAPKPTETWNWFAKLFHNRADVFPLSRPEHWELLRKLFQEPPFLSADDIEDRLSRWLDQRSGKITAWSAVDFLNECALMDEKEAGDIQGIVNEE